MKAVLRIPLPAPANTPVAALKLSTQPEKTSVNLSIELNCRPPSLIGLIIPGNGSCHAAATMLGLMIAIGSPSPSDSMIFSAKALVKV